MPGFRKSILSLLLMPLLLTGCWDLKDLQEINYLTALGFDLEDGEFVIYGQLLDFATVAKAQSGKSDTMPVWVGRGAGRTLVNAIDDLYRTSQLRVFYGHVNAIVLGERLLKDSSMMDQVEQFVGRYYELRYTPWIFGTSEKIGKIFAATSIFDLSPAVSILQQPQEVYRQRSVVHPITIREYAVDTNEPSRTALLPSLALSEENWSKGKEPTEMLAISGAYAMTGDQFRGWFSADKLVGLAWVEPGAYRGPLVLYDGKNMSAGMALEQPNIKIRPRVRNDKAEYAIEVALAGTLAMSMEQISEIDLETRAASKVREQIRELYKEGLKRGVDVLNLETSMFRYKNREWRKLKQSGGLELTADSLASIDVKVKITRTGNLKGQARFQ